MEMLKQIIHANPTKALTAPRGEPLQKPPHVGVESNIGPPRPRVPEWGERKI